MRRVFASLAALLAVTVSAIAAAIRGSAAPSGELYGLTDDNRLIGFSAADAGEIETNVRVSGLPAGASLIGIDVRPLDGKLYTVAKVGTTGHLYTLAPETGRATFVATLVAAGTTTPIALQGTQFGFDFNPAADALRIVSDAGQNLRALPSSRAAGPVGTTFTDGTLNDAGTTAAGITAAAYANNDNDAATGTTLYDIDSRLDGLAIQNPPNAGHARPRRRPRCRHHERGRLRHPHRGHLEHRLRVAHGAAGPWRDPRDALPGRSRHRRSDLPRQDRRSQDADRHRRCGLSRTTRGRGTRPGPATASVRRRYGASAASDARQRRQHALEGCQAGVDVPARTVVLADLVRDRTHLHGGDAGERGGAKDAEALHRLDEGSL